jgi:prolyl oligopeptidase
MGNKEPPQRILQNVTYSLGPTFVGGRLLCLTNCQAPNRRIVEIIIGNREMNEPLLVDVVPERKNSIRSWMVTKNHIYVAYALPTTTEIAIFTLLGEPCGTLPIAEGHTARLVYGNPCDDELFFEIESFTTPIQQGRYRPNQKAPIVWSKRELPFDPRDYDQKEVWFRAKDGTHISMFVVGRRDALAKGARPTVMTSYGGFGVPGTPQFSAFAAFLLERDCLFALPHIRGGSEFGADWHVAAKRQSRQVAIDDFLAASEWLLETKRTSPGKLAIFGGSNSGLLVGAAMTQRPDLFGAVICMVPMLDMLRYHLFDNAYVWKDELGTADDPHDFAALREYSPYHRVRKGSLYPATMIVSGDADQNCNPLHARKMTAALQAANASRKPIILAYSEHRGHSPVLPLSERIEALTDRMAFLCNELGLPVETEG